jgi:hypothetical protein
MELLAVSGLAYLGSILNQQIVSEHDKQADKKSKKIKKGSNNTDENFAFFNKRDYQNKEVDSINKKYKNRVKQIKDLSFIPEKSKVIPSFYNQMPAVGEQYQLENLPIPGKLDNTICRPAAPSLDDYYKFGEINKNKNEVPVNCELEVQQNWTPFVEGSDMTYGIFKNTELKHNNMQPFFRRRDDVVDNIGGKMTDEINSNNNMTKMELFTGSSKNYFPKEAPPAFFEPMKDVHFVNGMPSKTDELIDRFIPGTLRQGEKPFQPEQIQPGLNLGHHEMSKIGFHDSYRAPEPGIDYQRVGNRTQKSYHGVVIPGQKGQKQPVDPNVVKRRPEKVWEISDYMHGGKGNHGTNKPAVNPEQVVKPQTREFSMELKNGGGLATGSIVGPFSPDGKKRKPHKKQFDGLQSVGPSQQNVNNNNLPSYNLLDNQRTETGPNYYDGVPTNKEMNKGSVFNTQPLNSTMRQTTAETAQDGMAYGDVRKGTQFNTQSLNSTMRQTNAETAQDGMAYGDVRKGTQFNTQSTNSTLRQTNAETAQDGMAYGDVRKNTVFNTQSTNSTLRQTNAETAQDGHAYGDIKRNKLFNTQSSNSTLRQTNAETANEGFNSGSVKKVHQLNIQPTNSTLRQDMAEPANDGVVYGDTRKGHQFNKQSTNSTLRQEMAEPANDGGIYGDTRKGQQFNTQPLNPTLRQTNAEVAQDGHAYGDTRKGQQFNTQPLNATLRQTNAEVAQDGHAYGDARRGQQFNTQPLNPTLRQTNAEVAQDGHAYGDARRGQQFNTQPTNSTMRQTNAEVAQDGHAYGDARRGQQFNTQPTNSTMRQTNAETAQDGHAYADSRRGQQFNTQPTNSTMRQTTAENFNDGPAYGDSRKGNLFNTQPANSTLKQLAIDVPQQNPALHNVPKVSLYNDQPANPTFRQSVNYDGYNGPSHVLIESTRSRSDANAMTVHSAREDTTVGRTFTHSGWHEGVSTDTLGEMSSKQKDINNSWTRVNPARTGSRSNVLQDMDEFNLDERIVYKLNKLKDFPSMGDRIETRVAEMLQNNELINNAFQKYGNKPVNLYPNVHVADKVENRKYDNVIEPNLSKRNSR